MNKRYDMGSLKPSKSLGGRGYKVCKLRLSFLHNDL